MLILLILLFLIVVLLPQRTLPRRVIITGRQGETPLIGNSTPTHAPNTLNTLNNTIYNTL